MYVSAWDWFDDYYRTANANGDMERAKLPRTAYQAWRYQDANNFDLAIETFKEGANLARRLNERYWILFFEYWQAQGKLYHTRQIQEALDMLMRLTVQAHKPEYANCDPIRGQIFFTMADAYFEVDVYSYADEIRDLLDLIERDIPMDKDTHLRVLTLRSDLYFQFEKYDEALKSAHYYHAKSEGHDYRLYSAYVDLRRLAYSQGDLAGALDYAIQAEKYSYRKKSQLDEADCKLWQAALHMRLGNTSQAHALYQQGIALFERHKFVRWLSYYDAVSEYLEISGNPQDALTLRQKQLAAIQPEDGRLHECHAHLQHCRLLGRMGRSLDDALKAAEEVATRMKKPDLYNMRLERIRKGNFYEFDWQKS